MLKHKVFEDSDSYQIALLIKAASFNVAEITNNYIDRLNIYGIQTRDIIISALQYNESNKAPVKLIKQHLSELLLDLNSLKVTHLYVADAEYFKVLTKQTKADSQIGYIHSCVIKGYEHLKVTYGINYSALIYNPELQGKLNRSIDALADSVLDRYVPVGTNIIRSANYPSTLDQIALALNNLHQYSHITCDIETFSLRFNETGIGTIAFAWDRHNGCAFACDYAETQPTDELYGYSYINYEVRALLKAFFTAYQGTLIFHNATFDIKIMIHTLWMNNYFDIKGLYIGLDILTNNFHDTKVITYLATNSTAGNELGLKAIAQEFAGIWAMEEINDIRNVPLTKLLEYNLVDALSTFFVYEKYKPIMKKDNQEDLYNGLMLDTVRLLIQVELTGMPMSKTKINALDKELVLAQQNYVNLININIDVEKALLIIQEDAMHLANSKLKVKQHPLSKFSSITFNPNSNIHLAILLHQVLDLPVIDLTPTKLPSTGSETIEKLVHHATQQSTVDLLKTLVEYNKVTTILSTFMPAFKQAISKDTNDDTVWLHGSFNLGGTLSGRLSSSKPNLTNLPANSKYGSKVKEAFVAPQEYIQLDIKKWQYIIAPVTIITEEHKNEI